MRIHLLPIQLANQIAAGEVIERPASVVKELLENSLDADATTIEIDIEKGGSQLIAISDNGCGIHAEDLTLALTRHGTSKIRELEDLEQVTSLGFRGEALASIASVSRLSLATCTTQQTSGWQIQSEGSVIESHIKPVAHPSGTTIKIRDLFFNTPARRKFMRSEKTEFSHIEEIVKKLALSRFELRIALTHNQRKILVLTPAITNISKEQRIAKICGQEFINNSIHLDFEAGDLHLSGWISLPNYFLSQPNLQYFYVNGRIIKDKIITHAIRQAYESLIPNGKHAAYVLYFRIIPNAVDVNVHPTKHEIRFRESRLVHDFIFHALNRALNNNATIAPEKSFNRSFESNSVNATLKENPAAYDTLLNNPIKSELKFDNADNKLGLAIRLWQETFLVTENGSSLFFIDVPSAQKKIIYQQLTHAWKHNTIVSQPLLFPENILLSKKHVDLFHARIHLLIALKFDIEEISENTLMLRQWPSLLNEIPRVALIQEICAAEKISEMPDLISLIATYAGKCLKLSSQANDLNNFLRKLEQLNLLNQDICHELSLSDVKKLIA